MYQPSYLPRLQPMPSSSLASATPNSNLSTYAPAHPISHTRDPIVTGGSVLAIKYKDGVMMAADTLASYGSLARFKDMQRFIKVGDNTVLGVAGDMSDFQHIKNLLDSLVAEEYSLDDGHKMGPEHIFEYLATIMYNRRNKFDPLWNLVVVGGVDKNGQNFLGCVDLRGGTYKASTIGTGYGAYIAQPLLRQRVEGYEHELTEEQAREILEESKRVLLYRETTTINRMQTATVTSQGVKISEPYSLSTDWSVGTMFEGYK